MNNSIKTGDLLGKVEATTFLNTRLRTFDGKTVFVPNRKILDDYLINYHFTPTRRVKTTPRPVVYVLNLADSYVALGGRCWVDNLKYWVTKCELAEKVKLRFDREGILFAFPQRDVHLYYKTQPTAF